MNIVQKVARIVQVRRMFIAGALLCILPAGKTFAQVLDQVPSDSLVVMKFNHLQDTSGKMGALMQALGITDFAPQMQDPLGAFQKQAGMENGLDKSGEMAIVLLNGPFPDDSKPNADGKQTPPPVMALVPVADYKAFLANATVVKTEGEITTVHFKNNETEDNFVANWGSYAVISPNKEALSKKPAGMKLAGAASGELSKRDAILYVNWPSVKALLLPKLQESRQKVLDELEKNMNRAGGGDSKNTPVVRAVVNEAMDIAEAFMKDSVATTVGIDFDKAGLMATALTEFTPESYMGKLSNQLKGTDKPLLTGLPDTKYMFYGGSATDPAITAKVFNDLVEPLRKDIGDMGDSGKAILSMIDSNKEVIGSVEGGSFGWVAPNPNQMGQIGIFQMVANYHGDAQKLHDVMMKNYSQMDAFMNEGMMAGKGTAKNTVTKEAKTIEGVKIDQVQTQISMTGNTPQEMQANQMIGIMYGPNGLVTNVGVTDPKTLMLVISGDDALLNTAVAASKGQSNALGTADVLKDVDSHLPKNRVAVMYLPLDVIVSTAVGYATKFGMPVPVQIPPNLPPIGMTISAEGNAIRGDEFIPTPLVQSLIAAGMQMYVQMHGGQQGGGGGL